MKKKIKENKMINEFKSFISRGNVVDMAVGVIIGGAFGKIVTSLVNDVLMPLIGVLLGGLDFSNLSIKFNDATIAYGLFIQTIIDFLIIALAVFVFIKALTSAKNLRKKQEAAVAEEPAPEPEPTKEEVLLAEIRDILKNK